MFIKNIYYFLKILVLLFVLVTNGLASGFVFHNERKNTCLCGHKWVRFVIKYFGLGICGLALIAFFTPIVSILRMIPLLGGLVVLIVFAGIFLMLYCVQRYMGELQTKECDCVEKEKVAKVAKILSFLNTTNMLITTAVLVLIIMYLF